MDENKLAEDDFSRNKFMDVSLSSTLDPETGCEIFDGYKCPRGYGSKRVKDKIYKAHRVKWIQENGMIPNNLHVCHKCDNPPCINIDHLFLGTHAENMEDMKNKGRTRWNAQKGKDNYKSKLEDIDIPFIRLARGIFTQSRLAEIFGVARGTIQKVQENRIWKHI